MAKILVVDDSPSNRSLLVEFLGSCGHSIREATDGADALALVSADRPDLVITDILMPTMDGYEFVRRLRSVPDIAGTPVIFWTAHFREHDARDLAKECGVEYTLTKPCHLATVRRTVEACLSRTSPPQAPVVTENFDRDHLRLVMDTLTKQTNEFAAVNSRLEALVETSLRLASETDPGRLLQEFCKSARHLISSKYALVGIEPENRQDAGYLTVAGVSLDTYPCLKSLPEAHEAVARLLQNARSRRMMNLGGDPAALGFPPEYPRFTSVLAAPIVSPNRSYGWLCLFHRLGAIEFSEEDERLAGILGALAGRIFESGKLHTTAQRHAVDMEREVAVRVRTEEALRTSEVRYRLFFENNPLPGWLFDLATLRFLDVNHAAIEHYGYSRDEFLAMTILDVRPPDDIPVVVERIADLATGVPQMGRWTHRKKNGELIDVEVISYTLPGDPPSVFTLVRDITDRLRAEEEVRETTERLNLALTASQTGVWTWDAIADRSLWDSHAYEIFGVSPDNFGSKLADLASILHPDDRDEFMKSVTSPGDVIDGDLRVLWPDGSIRYVASRGRAFFDESKRLVRVTGVVQDVTDQRKLKEQLRQAQKMEAIGQLAGGIAHDFNNVLNVIIGYSKLLLAGSTPDDPAHRRVDEIRKAGERAAELTQQLLAFSRKQVLQPRVVNLGDTLRDMDHMVRRIIGEHLEVATHIDDDLGQVKIDPNQVHQVILNLVVNARDAMPDGGRLTLELANAELDETAARVHNLAEGKYVMLAVSDTGCGMTPEVKQRVFEPFFTTKEAGQGTGLGLATVYGIVQQSGACISVYSEPGIGTTFKIYFPRVPAPEEAECVETPVRITGGAETILVVEDDSAVRSLVEEILSSAGYHVLTAENGEKAFTAAQEYAGKIHLLLTDVVLPRMSGKEIAGRFAALRPSMKVLFMSGYTGNAIAQQGTLDPAVDFIQKPFTPEGLSGKIRAVLTPRSSIQRVLVVDDDESLRNLLCETLENAGFQAFTAHDGKSARAEAARNPVDLVITDLAMPEEDGMELIRALQKDQPHIKIVAMSGAFGAGVLRAAQLLGAHASLTKPLSAETILGCIDHLSRPRA